MTNQNNSARIDHDDDSAVVIIGSGAGGGTLAHELVEKGIKVVLLEAGPYLTNEDYHQDEWAAFDQMAWLDPRDRKSTRLNSSHVSISYAVFCLKKKTK